MPMTTSTTATKRSPAKFTALFEINPKKNSVELAAEEIREISPGILSVDCVAAFSDTEGADEKKETADVDFSALLVKQSNGGWLFRQHPQRRRGKLAHSSRASEAAGVAGRRMGR